MVLGFCAKYCVFGDRHPYQAELPLYQGSPLHENRPLANPNSILDDRFFQKQGS